MNVNIINRKKSSIELKEATNLLKEAVYFMNQVPNNRYLTYNGDRDHYKLCKAIDNFLKLVE